MREKIINDIKEAMKSQDKEKLAVLRMVKGAMQLEEINKKQELNDEDVIAVISKQIKTRKESIVEFEKGNRQDLIEQTEREINILNEYMPEQLSEEEVTQAVKTAISTVEAASIKDMGKVMAELKAKYAGQLDFGKASGIIKSLLS